MLKSLNLSMARIYSATSSHAQTTSTIPPQPSELYFSVTSYSLLISIPLILIIFPLHIALEPDISTASSLLLVATFRTKFHSFSSACITRLAHSPFCFYKALVFTTASVPPSHHFTLICLVNLIFHRSNCR